MIEAPKGHAQTNSALPRSPSINVITILLKKNT